MIKYRNSIALFVYLSVSANPAGHMMTSSNGNIFCFTGPLWGESTSHQWILHTKTIGAELWCFLWSAPEQTVVQTRHQRMCIPAWGLIRGNGNTEMVTRGAILGLCGLFVKTPLTSVNPMFEIDWVIIISHNGIFSDIGQKPPYHHFHLANVVQKKINSEHSPNKCTHQVWIGLHEHFSRYWSKTNNFSHFVATRGSKFGQRGQKENHFWTLIQQVYTTSLNWIVWTFFQIMVKNLSFWPIFSNSLATRGPKLGQHHPKANQFWTLSQQMLGLNLKWIEWILFQIMVRNPRQTDGQTLTMPIYMSPLNFIDGDNYRDAGNLRRHSVHYDVTVMHIWFREFKSPQEKISTHQ